MNEIICRMEAKWDQGAANYDRTHVDNEDSKPWLEAMSKIFGTDTKKSVLDVGTGTGFIVLKAAQLGFKCMGLDMSEGMMAEAKKHANDFRLDIGFIKSYVENTPFAENTFDIVTNRCLLWTLTEPQNALTEWRRILNPGGMLCCFCHISEGHGPHNHYDQDIEDMLPLKGASIERYIEEYNKAGYKNVQAIGLPGIPSMHGGNTSENNCWYAFTGEK